MRGATTDPGEPYLLCSRRLAELCRKAPCPDAAHCGTTWLLQLPSLSSAEERDGFRRELTGLGGTDAARIGELLDRYTEQRPLLLLTEDLHWSDRATTQPIDHDRWPRAVAPA